MRGENLPRLDPPLPVRGTWSCFGNFLEWMNILRTTSLLHCMTFFHCNLDSGINSNLDLACEKYETKVLVLIFIVSLMHHSSFPQYVDILVLVKCVTNTCHSSDRVHSACHLNIEILTSYLKCYSRNPPISNKV